MMSINLRTVLVTATVTIASLTHAGSFSDDFTVEQGPLTNGLAAPQAVVSDPISLDSNTTRTLNLSNGFNPQPGVLQSKIEVTGGEFVLTSNPGVTANASAVYTFATPIDLVDSNEIDVEVISNTVASVGSVFAARTGGGFATGFLVFPVVTTPTIFRTTLENLVVGGTVDSFTLTVNGFPSDTIHIGRVDAVPEASPIFVLGAGLGLLVRRRRVIPPV